ncbi:Xaa-Pro aminopeptidase [subsurface metagenome]
MIETKEYIRRRQVLRNKIETGIIVLCGNNMIARNYPGNLLPFRQDSNFLYYLGIDIPGCMCIIDCDNDVDILFGNDPGIDDQIWRGSYKKMQDIADKAGVKKVFSLSKIKDAISKARKTNQRIHFLPPYPTDRQILLSELIGIPLSEISKKSSVELIQAVITQRSVKSEEEVIQIEEALNKATGPMHQKAMRMAFPGVYEYQIVAEMNKIAKACDLDFAYPVICSVHGEILHNEFHRNQLEKDQLLLIDAGAESSMHYASDITRTIPVGGRFNEKQKEIYAIVLSAEVHAIDRIKPGIKYADLHREAALMITQGLKTIGIMKGEPEEAVEKGAHALFFPHGLGHMMGLDVHDMEDLGENFVGYGNEVKRSSQFGTAYLRLARSLQPGFVLTVEPGIYFIPTLIDLWRSEKKFEKYINYSIVEAYKKLGGIRIEDNILVHSSGCKVLGNPIPKFPAEIEKFMNSEG